MLRGFGLKVGAISRGRFAARIRDIVEGQTMLETVVGAMLAARATLQAEFERLHRTLLALVRNDPVCQPHERAGRWRAGLLQKRTLKTAPFE